MEPPRERMRGGRRGHAHTAPGACPRWRPKPRPLRRRGVSAQAQMDPEAEVRGERGDASGWWGGGGGGWRRARGDGEAAGSPSGGSGGRGVGRWARTPGAWRAVSALLGSPRAGRSGAMGTPVFPPRTRPGPEARGRGLGALPGCARRLVFRGGAKAPFGDARAGRSVPMLFPHSPTAGTTALRFRLGKCPPPPPPRRPLSGADCLLGCPSLSVLSRKKLPPLLHALWTHLLVVPPFHPSF